MPSISFGHNTSDIHSDTDVHTGPAGIDSIDDEARFSSASQEHPGVGSSRMGGAASLQPLTFTKLADGNRLYKTGYPSIYAKTESDEDFAKQVKAALDKIARAPSGKKLLEDIRKTSEGPEGKHVSIVKSTALSHVNATALSNKAVTPATATKRRFEFKLGRTNLR